MAGPGGGFAWFSIAQALGYWKALELTGGCRPMTGCAGFSLNPCFREDHIISGQRAGMMLQPL